MNNLQWLFLSLVVVFLDQVTKYLASHFLYLHKSVMVLPGLDLTLMHNTGAAFSFLSQAGGWQRWFFISLASIVSLVLTIWILRLPRENRWMACTLALILGGAFGNLIDRILFGYVVDFIDVYYHSWHWPAFNIADSAITVGAVMLIIDTLRPDKQDITATK